MVRVPAISWDGLFLKSAVKLHIWRNYKSLHYSAPGKRKQGLTSVLQNLGMSHYNFLSVVDTGSVVFSLRQ